MVIAMVRGKAPDITMLGGITVLLTLRVLTPKEALDGFSNPGMVTVAVLYVVAAGLRDTGALDAIVPTVLGVPKRAWGAQLRMMVPVAITSAFINNTPVVAIFLPLVIDWARRIRVSASKLLMPLSFATILGGTTSIIGTSTNLVVTGLAGVAKNPIHFALFDIAWLGIPTLIVGLTYMLMASRWLLPNRDAGGDESEHPREFMVAMRVDPDSAVIGKTIEQAGLRHLPGLFLVEIQRGERVLPAASPDTLLEANDQLLFAGLVESVVDLRRIRGLSPAINQLTKLVAPRPERRLIEVVVAARSSLAGLSIREARFRTEYDGAVIAVHRGAERVRSKIGDIVLKPGDVLLVEAHRQFVDRHRNDSNFALVREVEGSATPHYERAWVALLVTVVMIVANAFELIDLLQAALLAATAMLVTRCISVPRAFQAIEGRVLITIAASFAIGTALEKTGLARVFGESLVAVAHPLGPMAVVVGIYVATTVLTNFITNNSAAALMFPLTMAAAKASGLDPKPLLLVLMMAASASFATPIGYQTNLMVYGPGRYTFGDFVRFGVPMQVILACVTLGAYAVVF